MGSISNRVVGNDLNTAAGADRVPLFSADFATDNWDCISLLLWDDDISKTSECPQKSYYERAIGEIREAIGTCCSSGEFSEEVVSVATVFGFERIVESFYPGASEPKTAPSAIHPAQAGNEIELSEKGA